VDSVPGWQGTSGLVPVYLVGKERAGGVAKNFIWGQRSWPPLPEAARAAPAPRLQGHAVADTAAAHQGPTSRTTPALSWPSTIGCSTTYPAHRSAAPSRSAVARTSHVTRHRLQGTRGWHSHRPFEELALQPQGPV